MDKKIPNVENLLQQNSNAADDSAMITPGGYRVIRRNGKITVFDGSKISVAITKAFLAVEGGNAAASKRIHESVENLTNKVVAALTRRIADGDMIHIEDIQDQVELALMRGGYHKVARAYVLYREERARERIAEQAKKGKQGKAKQAPALNVVLEDGTSRPLDRVRIETVVTEACEGLENVDSGAIIHDTLRNL